MSRTLGLTALPARPLGPGNQAVSVLCSLTTKTGADNGVSISDRAGSRHQGGPAATLGAPGKWPVAFPVKDQDVRPLAIGAASEIAAAMGWSFPYTLGVLGRWKMASVYCRAVLYHDQRIALDGAPAEPVRAEAKDLAAKQLARLAGARPRKP
jgi:hypothetical protein